MNGEGNQQRGESVNVKPVLNIQEGKQRVCCWRSTEGVGFQDDALIYGSGERLDQNMQNRNILSN